MVIDQFFRVATLRHPGEILFESFRAKSTSTRWHCKVSFLCVCFLENLTESRLLSHHISYLRNTVGSKRTKLAKDNILCHEGLVAYCHVIVAAEVFLSDRRFNFDALENIQLGSEIMASQTHP